MKYKLFTVHRIRIQPREDEYKEKSGCFLKKIPENRQNVISHQNIRPPSLICHHLLNFPIHQLFSPSRGRKDSVLFSHSIIRYIMIFIDVLCYT